MFNDILKDVKRRSQIKIKELYLFSTIILVISVSMPGKFIASSLESWQTSCGAACLRTVTGLLGDQRDLSEIRELLRPNDRGEISLAEISETAQKMGFYTTGLRIETEKLQESSLPLIVHKPPQHFIVILRLGKGKGVMIIDPPKKTKVVKLEELAKQQEIWNVVAISKYPIKTKGMNTRKTQEQTTPKEELLTESGGLKFDNVVWNLGTVRPDKQENFEFSFKNVSKKLITLSNVKANCACLKVVEFPAKVDPGQQGQIKVTLDTKGLQGYIAKSVIAVLKKNGSDTEERILLKAIGEVTRRGELLLKPSEINLPDVIKGSKTNKLVTIVRIGNNKLLLNEIKSDSNNVTTMIHSDMEKNAHEVNIDIQYEAQENTGPFEHNLVIKTDFPEYPLANLRIYGNIVSHISIEPKEALFSLVSDKSPREKNITLKSKKDKPFTIINIKTTTDDVEVEYKPVKDDKTEWQVKLTASQIMQKGIFKGEIIVTTDDPDLPKIEIPYTGLVVE